MTVLDATSLFPVTLFDIKPSAPQAADLLALPIFNLAVRLLASSELCQFALDVFLNTGLQFWSVAKLEK